MSTRYQQGLNLPSSAWQVPGQVYYIANQLAEIARDASDAAQSRGFVPREEH